MKKVTNNIFCGMIFSFTDLSAKFIETITENQTSRKYPCYNRLHEYVQYLFALTLAFSFYFC